MAKAGRELQNLVEEYEEVYCEHQACTLCNLDFYKTFYLRGFDRGMFDSNYTMAKLKEDSPDYLEFRGYFKSTIRWRLNDTRQPLLLSSAGMDLEMIGMTSDSNPMGKIKWQSTGQTSLEVDSIFTQV